MAITSLCSSSPTPSPTLPSISLPSLPSNHPSLKTHFLFSSLSTKFDSNLISHDAALAIVAAEQAGLLLASAAAMEEVGRRNADVERTDGCRIRNFIESESGMEMDRREARRKRRNQMEFLGQNEDKVSEANWLLSKSVRPKFFSPREEADLCFCFKEGTKVEASRKTIMEAQEHEPSIKQLSNALGKKIRSVDKTICQGRESKERIIRCYKRLVVSIASGYQGRGLSLQDLIQEGSIGLLRGVEKFDPEKGYKLSTYVYWWIKQAIIRALENKSRLVRLPGNICQMLPEIAEAKRLLGRRLMRNPTHNEIAEMLNVHVSTVKLVSERTKRPFSLNQPLTDRGPMTLQEIMTGPDEFMPEKMEIRRLKKSEVEKLLRSLSEREAHILRLYFGLDGEIPRSFEEIGKMLKLSRERVRQINVIALSRLRQTSIPDYLKLLIA